MKLTLEQARALRQHPESIVCMQLRDREGLCFGVISIDFFFEDEPGKCSKSKTNKVAATPRERAMESVIGSLRRMQPLVKEVYQATLSTERALMRVSGREI